MEIRDLSPIDEPAIGKIITESFSIEKLKKCCLYVLPSDMESVVGEAVVVLSGLVKHTGKKEFLNRYSIKQLKTLSRFENTLKLRAAIKKEKPTFLMLLNTPSRNEQYFLIVRSQKDRLMRDIPLILYSSERITKGNIVELMLQHSIWDEEDFFNRITKLLPKKWLLPTMSRDYVGNGAAVSFGMSAGTSPCNSPKEIDLREHLVEIISTYKENRRDESVYTNLRLLFNSISNEDIINYFASLPLDELKRLQSFVSAQQLAKKSKIKIEIRRVGHTNRHRPTDGIYRIFFIKEGEEKQLHFNRRSSFVLYLMYLLDVVKNEMVVTLNLKVGETTFRDLFVAVYAYDDGAKYFKTLFGKGTSEQQLLRHCYSDIRTAVTRICRAFNESPSPFIISDANSRLHVFRDRIIVDRSLYKYI